MTINDRPPTADDTMVKKSDAAGANGTKPSWEEIAAKKRQALLDSIPAEWRIPADLVTPDTQDDVTGWPEASGWFTPQELAITNATAADLLPQLASGQLKSLDVTRAFCKRACAAHQLVCSYCPCQRRTHCLFFFACLSHGL